MLKCPHFTTAIIAVGALTFPICAFANDSIVNETTKWALEENSKQETEFLSEGGPNDRPNAGFVHPNIQISREENDTILSLGFSIKNENFISKPENGDGYYRISKTNFSIVGSTPLEQNGEGSLFSKDNLVNGSSIKLTYSSITNTLGSGKNTAIYLQTAYDICVLSAIQNWKAPEGEAIEQVDLTRISFLRALDKEKADPDSFVYPLSIPIGESKLEQNLNKFVLTECKINQENGKYTQDWQLIEDHIQKGDEYRKAYFNKNSQPVFWGIDAAIATKEYTYLDQASFALNKSNRESWELGTYAGLISADSEFSFRARASIGRSYSTPEEIEDCRTVSGLTEPKCLSGANGPPVSKINGLLSLETRHVFQLYQGQKIGFAPQVTYRYNEKELIAELPIFLASSNGGALNGGIKFGYESGKDDFAMSLFIGIPFERILGK